MKNSALATFACRADGGYGVVGVGCCIWVMERGMEERENYSPVLYISGINSSVICLDSRFQSIFPFRISSYVRRRANVAHPFCIICHNHFIQHRV